MKNKNLLSLLETTASLQEQGEGSTEFENLGQELALKIRGGQTAEPEIDVHLNGSCPVVNNNGCGKG